MPRVFLDIPRHQKRSKNYSDDDFLALESACTLTVESRRDMLSFHFGEIENSFFSTPIFFRGSEIMGF